MTATDDTDATAVGPDRRWTGALWWSLLVFVPALVIGRVGDHGPVIIPLGAVVAAIVFVVVLRTTPAVVTREEVRLPKRTIRRADVTAITRSEESTALVFRGPDGGVVGVADLFERSGRFREALERHGWPEVDRPG